MDGHPPFGKAPWASMAIYLERVGDGILPRTMAILVISACWPSATFRPG
jgi:hypothetical protein